MTEDAVSFSDALIRVACLEVDPTLTKTLLEALRPPLLYRPLRHERWTLCFLQRCDNAVQRRVRILHMAVQQSRCSRTYVTAYKRTQIQSTA